MSAVRSRLGAEAELSVQERKLVLFEAISMQVLAKIHHGEAYGLI